MITFIIWYIGIAFTVGLMDDDEMDANHRALFWVVTFLCWPLYLGAAVKERMGGEK